MINFSNIFITSPKTFNLPLGVAGKEILTLSALYRSCQFLPQSDRTKRQSVNKKQRLCSGLASLKYPQTKSQQKLRIHKAIYFQFSHFEITKLPHSFIYCLHTTMLLRRATDLLNIT